VRSGDLASARAVVVASERMDDNPAWRRMRPGELVHVDERGTVSFQTALPSPPARQLTLADLHPEAAASQAPHPRASGGA
jgi:glutamine amidotransferase